MNAAPYTILVIDDDYAARSALADLLEKPAYHIETAENGAQGLEIARDINPDVILLDVMMPRMDGYDVCRNIRADCELKETPVIMLTALDDRKSKLNGLLAGADDFLTKPFDQLELEIRLQTLRHVNRYRRLLEEREKLKETLAQVSNEYELLRALSKKMMDAQESERRRVAGELHNEIGQMLAGLKLMLEQSAGHSAEARQITSQVLNRLREISAELRPSDLDDLGLSAALNGLIRRFTRQTGIAIRHNINPLEKRRFDPYVETALFRVAQEALSNVARHAGVYEANLQLRVLPDEARLRISDAGSGFDPEVQTQTAGGGLASMAQRVRMGGGEFSLHSAPEKGTVILASFPILPDG